MAYKTPDQLIKKLKTNDSGASRVIGFTPAEEAEKYMKHGGKKAEADFVRNKGAK